MNSDLIGFLFTLLMFETLVVITHFTLYYAHLRTMWVGFYFAYLYDYLRQAGVVHARVTKHVQLYVNHAIIWNRFPLVRPNLRLHC